MEAVEDAAKCRQIAANELALGNLSRALKFAEKGLRFLPNDSSLRALRDQIQDKINNGNKNSTSNGSTENSPNTNRPNATQNFSQPSSAEYTSEQLEEVRIIKSRKCYYEILGVPKQATEVEIKKQYKKLALKFHPDKNKAPGAEDAFKAVSAAFSCLTDPKKKQIYDTYGSLSPEQEQASANPYYRSGGHTYYHSGGFDDEDFFELFEAMFGGSMNNMRRQAYGQPRARFRQPHAQGTHFYQTNMRREANNEGHFAFNCIQLLPILFLVVLSLLSFTSSNDPLFQFHKTDKYSIPKTTRDGTVEYFVKEDFKKQAGRYYNNYHELERDVIQSYRGLLQGNCRQEQVNKHRELQRIKFYYSGQDRDELLRALNEQEPESCVKLRKVIEATG